VDGVWVVSDLAPGTYRAFAGFAVLGATSPEEFVVSGEQTIVEWHVNMPRHEEIFVQMFRPDGSLLTGSGRELIEVRRRSWQRKSSSEVKPEWAHERIDKHSDEIFLGGRAGGAYSSFGPRPSWDEAHAEHLGFAFGKLEQSTRETRHTHTKRFRIDGGRDVRIAVKPQGHSTYVAVLVDPRDVQANLVFPAGDPGQDLTDNMWIEATALAVGPGPSGPQESDLQAATAWRDVKVRIRIEAADYKTVSLYWKPADGSLPTIDLTRASG